MKRRIALLAGALWLASLSAYSQQQLPVAEDPNHAPAAPAPHKQRIEQEPVIPSVFFEGGPVRKLLEVLRVAGRKAGLAELNVIVPDELQLENVPPLELHNVRYGDVFQALNKLNPGGAGSNWQLSMSGESSIWVLGPPAHVSNALPVLQIDPATGQPLIGGQPPKNCQIYSLQRYLTKYKVEDITTAIRTAWEMMGADKGAELKYHKDTSLLIAVGQAHQLEIISRVLHSLEEGLARNDGLKNGRSEVFVNGAVNKPGVVSITPEQDLDILGALAHAGGLTPRANENKIKFTRPGVMEKTLTLEELKKGPKNNVPLQPGDIIEVAEKLF